MVRAWLGEDGRGLLRISAVCRRDDSGKFAENSENFLPAEMIMR